MRKVNLPVPIPEGYVRIYEGKLNEETDLILTSSGGWVKVSDLSDLGKWMLSDEVKSFWAVCRKE